MSEGLSTVLVTGAAGSLGRGTVERLCGAGYRVRVLAHHQEPLLADEVVWGDLRSGAGLQDACRGVETVLHMAACTHARRPDRYWEVNSTGTSNLLKASSRAGVEHFILLSSRAAVAGGGAYAESKLAAEGIVGRSDLLHTILRPGEVYAGAAKEGVGAILDQARKDRLIPIPGDGSQRLCPAHVEDICDAIAATVSVRPPQARYLLAGPGLSLREFAERCVAAFSSSSRIVPAPMPLVRVAAATSRWLPLSIYPDQIDRLLTPKPEQLDSDPGDLGFFPRTLDEGLRSLPDC